jgi:hypothetical protein
MDLAKQIEKIDPTFWPRCREYKYCDIDQEFMGFTDIYKHLAKIIPKDKIVVDLGCAYAPQAVYFTKHKKYIGVDLVRFDTPRVKTDNSEYNLMTIKEWVDRELPKYKKEELFAICSFVPPWHGDNQRIVRENFLDVFVYYPRGDN